jgi:hypothetical protein
MSSQQEYHDYVLPYYYGIKPSWALAVAATFLFACVTLTHFVLLFLKRAWFLIPLLTGALCMCHCHEKFLCSVPANYMQITVMTDLAFRRDYRLCLSRRRTPSRPAKPIDIHLV